MSENMLLPITTVEKRYLQSGCLHEAEVQLEHQQACDQRLVGDEHLGG